MMNRQQRRAQAKAVPTPRPPGLLNLKEVFEAGVRHHQAGQLAEAERFYRQVLAVDARHTDAMHLLGMIASQRGQDQIAVKIISKAIEINPTAAVYHYNLGTALLNLRRLDDAYNNAVLCKPDYADALSDLGLALKDLGHLDDAVIAYNDAIRFKPDHAVAHSNLGLALQDLGRLDDAVASCNNALRFQPDSLRPAPIL